MIGPILIILCTVLWATDAIFRQPLTARLDPSTIVLFEHLVCIVTTFPLFLYRIDSISKIPSRGWLALGFIGVIGSAFGTYFFTTAYAHVNPSVVILLQKLQPAFAVAGAYLVLRERPSRQFYAWALVSVVAATMVSLPEVFSHQQPIVAPGQASPQTWRGLLFGILAAFAWGLSTVFGKWITNHTPFETTTFLRFVFGLLGVLILRTAKLAYYEELPLGVSWSDLGSLIYMGAIPGSLAMYLYYAGLARTKAIVAAFAELFFPIAAVTVNWLVLGHRLTAIQIAGMGLLLFSVYFVNRTARK